MFAWLLAFFLGYEVPPPMVYTVTHDEGGKIDIYRDNLRLFRSFDIKVRIDGPCFSTCTMYASLPNVCVTPRAVFLFHQGTHKHATSAMWRHWTPELRKLVESYGPLPTFASGQYISIGFDDLKTILPTCS